MQLALTVLVSTGRNPLTHRARRAPQDARALELALRLNPAKLVVLHAGDPNDPALRAYLGMGVSQIDVITTPPGADPYPALRAHIEIDPPDLVICGMVASDCEGDGLTPYALAEDLGWPILSAVRRLEVEDGRAIIEQSLPGGRTRRLRATCPAVVAVEAGAPPPRQIAFAKSLRGNIRSLATQIELPQVVVAWTAQPAKRRGSALPAIDANASAAERLRAITESPAKSGEMLIEPDPQAAAERLLEYLTREGLISMDQKESRA